MQSLVRGNELYLAFIVAQNFCKEAVSEVTTLLAERAEKYFCADIALDLLQRQAKDQRQVQLTKRRLINSFLLKDTEGLEKKYS